MSNPLISLLALSARQAKSNFLKQTNRIEAVQAKFLKTLLRNHGDTELGRQFGLASISTLAEFRDCVPVLPYSEYAPYMERAAAGKRNVITPYPLSFVYVSSGSTGSRKLVPVTAKSRQAVGRANQAATGFGFGAAQYVGLPLGKMLLTTSAKPLGKTSGGIEYGHVSGGGLRQIPRFLFQQAFAQPFEALLISNGVIRNYVCLLFALQCLDLRLIGANFPVLALQLCDVLERYAESLIEDIAVGQISPDISVEPELRPILNQQLKPNPQRAGQLRQILRANGRLTPALAWPNFSFVTTAKGGTSNFYLERFPEYFGNKPVFGGTYASAEATFGVHRGFETEGSALAIESSFFEFVPSDQWDVDQPKTLLPHEVKRGELYRILVTNYSGFYRYDIGDVVEVQGFLNQTPIIVFRYRQGGTLSATTEKTTEYHANWVMETLQRDHQVLLDDYCITLSEDVIAAHYVLNIELATGQTLDNPDLFLLDFDRKLQEANISYALKRPNNDIPGPSLRILAPGSFAALRQRKLKSGANNDQMKFSHISGDRTLLKGLTVDQDIPFPANAERSKVEIW